MPSSEHAVVHHDNLLCRPFRRIHDNLLFTRHRSRYVPWRERVRVGSRTPEARGKGKRDKGNRKPEHDGARRRRQPVKVIASGHERVRRNAHEVAFAVPIPRACEICAHRHR